MSDRRTLVVTELYSLSLIQYITCNTITRRCLALKRSQNTQFQTPTAVNQPTSPRSRAHGQLVGDDMMIKSWDWGTGWKCTMDRYLEGYARTLHHEPLHQPEGPPIIFASLCLDRTVKIWSLTNLVPNFTLEAHDKGVNYGMSRSTRVLINRISSLLETTGR